MFHEISAFETSTWRSRGTRAGRTSFPWAP